MLLWAGGWRESRWNKEDNVFRRGLRLGKSLQKKRSGMPPLMTLVRGGKKKREKGRS